LTSRGLPLVVLSAVCGTASLWLLIRSAETGARLLAAGAVTSVVIAWGVGQWDFMLPTSLTVAQAAAPDGTIAAVLVVVAIAAVFILPAFVLLYMLDQRSLLPGEGVPEATPPSA
jgi:cytochrome d ubiquinol oxidase subunit II